MSDMTATIAPKSDQLNSDDLIGRDMTIKITKVEVKPSVSGDQPVSIYFEGDRGKPYKPCKSMRRILVQLWGADSQAYVGRSMTLYRDETVTWAGAAVGGIRIRAISHLDKAVTMALTATKATRKPFTVKPLKIEGTTPPKPISPPPAAVAPKPAPVEDNADAFGLEDVPPSNDEEPITLRVFLTAGPREFASYEDMKDWFDVNMPHIKTANSMTGFLKRNEENFNRYREISPDWMAIIDDLIEIRKGEIDVA